MVEIKTKVVSVISHLLLQIEEVVVVVDDKVVKTKKILLQFEIQVVI